MPHDAITLAHQLRNNPTLTHTTKTHIDNHAHCTTTDPELWYQEQGKSAKNAIKVCQDCPVQTSCLAYALATHQRHGTWGGHTEHNRRHIHKQLRLTSPT